MAFDPLRNSIERGAGVPLYYIQGNIDADVDILGGDIFNPIINAKPPESIFSQVGQPLGLQSNHIVILLFVMLVLMMTKRN